MRGSWLGVLLAGCVVVGGDPGTKDTGTADADIDADADADSDADADGDADTDADGDADADADGDADSDADTDTTPVDTGLPASCGDLQCAADEDCAGCPVDCGACPATCDGDGACTASDGETCMSCPGDCDTTSPVCGNGACDAGEGPVLCMADCGPPVWPADWAAHEDDVLAAMNAERAAGTDCPSGATDPQPALQLDPALRDAARLHSWDQSYSDYFDHDSCNGRSPWDRAPTARGENIAWNYRTPADAVDGWMTSTQGHCDAIMSGSYDYVGVGYADVNGEPLWTAMFR